MRVEGVIVIMSCNPNFVSICIVLLYIVTQLRYSYSYIGCSKILHDHSQRTRLEVAFARVVIPISPAGGGDEWQVGYAVRGRVVRRAGFPARTGAAAAAPARLAGRARHASTAGPRRR